MTEFKKAYDKRNRVCPPAGSESMTQQHFKKECDINYILKKYQKTGLVEHVQQFGGRYEDLSQPVDYQTALNIVIEANAAFSSLPSSVRKRFSNNPQEFLEFASNPDNAQEMAKLGLTKSLESPSVAQPPIESPSPAEPESPAAS